VITLGLMTGLAAVTVDMSLPAVPAMADALATSVSRGQQIVGFFMAGMAVGQIPAGLISDRLGRLPVLYLGMTLFEICAIVASIADNIELMLAARFVQGIGAAAAIVLSRAIVRDIASGIAAARLMSMITMIFTAAPVIAPSIGALLIVQWGWRSPFTAIAVFGALILVGIRSFIVETHKPDARQHPLRQLALSFRQFFAHRQSILGLLLIIVPPIGFMSLITVSSALIVNSYGYSVPAFGLIFAGAGLSILLGSAINRMLVEKFDVMQMLGIAVAIMTTSGLQLLAILIIDQAPLWWLWGNVCVFFLALGILLPNATVLALDPLPEIAGVASSIIGTLQNVSGSLGALGGAMIFTGSVRSSIILITAAIAATVCVFLLSSFIAPDALRPHSEMAAKD